MLIGEHIHTLDDKNRVSLPAKFKKFLGKEVVITVGLDQCLFIFTVSEWKTISATLLERSFLQADNRSFNRYMFGAAEMLPVDASGRILIPEHLKVRAGLGNKVAFIGLGNRLEVWNEDTWNSYKNKVEQSADTLAEKLGGVGVI